MPSSGFAGFQIDALARFAPTYAFYSVPAEVPENEIRLGQRGRLKFVTSAYVNQSVSGWMADFLAGLAILQPIAAQGQAEHIAQIVGCETATSAPPKSGELLPPDDLMELVNTDYRPAGQAQSRWHESPEFKQFAEHYGRTDRAFGTASGTGLTVETPMGDDTALLQLSSAAEHPVLGNGLACRLTLPFNLGDVESRRLAERINFAEATQHTFFPLIGSWSSFPVRPDAMGVAFNSFIPNFLFMPLLVPNIALWMLARADWVKREFFPELKDLALSDILQKRLEDMGRARPARDH